MRRRTAFLDASIPWRRRSEEATVSRYAKSDAASNKLLRVALTLFIVVVVTSFVSAAAYVSLVIVERQASLGKVSRYNIAWSAGQAVAELTRLQTAIARAGNPAVGDDADAVMLRYEIFLNRLSLLSEGAFAEFVHANPSRVASLATVRQTVLDLKPLLPTVTLPTIGAKAIEALDPLTPLLIALASDANRVSGEAVSRDQAELVGLHWQFTGLVGGLILCGLGLTVVVFWNHHLLRRAYVVLQTTTEQLHSTTISRATLDKALTNMSQGLCMFDPVGRLVLANQRFGEILGLPAQLTIPGTTSRDLLCAARHRAGGSSLSERLLTLQQQAAADRRHASFCEGSESGTTIAVSHEPLADGGWLATYEDVTERKQIEAKIAHMASHDDLTDLGNRVLFREELQNSLSRLAPGKEVSILCLDLDHFKAVNDTLGHPIGDELLRAVAGRIRGCVRRGDTLARLGGDEFAIIQSASSQPEVAIGLAERLVQVLGEPFKLQEHQVVIGVSIGIASAPKDSIDPDTLLKQADLALYEAKGSGRSTYRAFELEMDSQVQARRALEVDLRRAIAEREFKVFYQPLVNAHDRRISGFEALLRWHHPERGTVMPSQFINLAEEIGAIGALGALALEQACNDAVHWPDDLSVAVNVSPMQFRTGDIVAIARAALQNSGLPPHRLQLEITETVLLSDTEAVIEILHRLRDLGVHISMDDFGTGYSSLSYLRKFPFDKIKIDRSFVNGLGTDPESDAIVSAVVSLSASLGIKTTVEGVETLDQLAWLESRGPIEVQGYLLGKPLPLDQTQALIDSSQRDVSSRPTREEQSEIVPFESRAALERRRSRGSRPPSALAPSA